MKKSLIALAALAASGCAMASSRRDYEDQARGHELRAMELGGLDATYYGKKAQSAQFNPGDGRGAFLVDKYAATASGFADSDEIRVLRIAAGTEVVSLAIQSADLDAHASPELVFRVGYRPCDSGSSLSADDDYFAAAGQTTAQAGGRLNCAFAPIRFEEDVWVIVTVNTDAATDQAGDIYAIAGVNCVGPAGNRSSGAM